MRHKKLVGTALVASVASLIAFGGAQAQMRGQGHMVQGTGSQPGQGMMGHMMHHGMGGGGMKMHGMMGRGAGFGREKALSNDEVRRVVDGRLALMGLSRLKAGTAKDAGEKAAQVDVVSEKGDMVFRLKVDRKSGRAAIIE